MKTTTTKNYAVVKNGGTDQEEISKWTWGPSEAYAAAKRMREESEESYDVMKLVDEKLTTEF